METPEFQYATTVDGVKIAYLAAGKGPAIVYASRPFGDASLYGLKAPAIVVPTDELTNRGWRVVLYDVRGMGASERRITDFSIEARAKDIEAVVDRIGLRRFVLTGTDASAAAAVAYCVQHPDKVEALVLINPWPTGKQRLDLPPVRAFTTPNSDPDEWLFRTEFLARESGEAQMDRVKQIAAGLQQASSPEAFLAMRVAVAEMDIRPLLPQVSVPALVVHNGHRFSSFELSRDVASSMPNARLLGIGVEGEAEAAAIDTFLRTVLVKSVERSTARLSRRELEVLRLIAAGRSNQQIADELVISLSTVLHHVTSILTKTGCANRTEAAAYAHRNGLVVAE